MPEVLATLYLALPSATAQAISNSAVPQSKQRLGSEALDTLFSHKTLVERIANHSLTLLERGFLCAEILLGLSLPGEDRDYLIPAKSNTKWERLSSAEQDGLLHMRVSPQSRAKVPPRIPDSPCRSDGLCQR